VNYTVFISNFLFLFFYFFIFINQINTARGLHVKMTMKDESDEIYLKVEKYTVFIFIKNQN
jgi:hypothetical protein